MSISVRRIRAILVMMALWAIPAAIFGAVFGVALWFGMSWSGSSPTDYTYFASFMMGCVRDFTVLGLLGGFGFSTVIARRGEGKSIEGMRATTGLWTWVGLGALAGLLRVGLLLTIQGAMAMDWGVNLLVLTVGGVTGGAIGGIAGTGIMAIARRAKALPGEAEPAQVGSGEI